MSIDLVTGGGGFIGSHLVDALLRQGRTVRVIDNFATGRPQNLAQHKGNDALTVMTGDVADQKVMAEAMKGVRRVFHLAALADIVPSVQNPAAYFRANVDGTFVTLEAARAEKVESFVYTASSSCYGIPDNYPTREDAPPRPEYPYALTKWMGESLAMHWAKIYDLPVTSLRLFNVYGPRARTSGTYGAVFGVFLAQLLAGKPLTIVGDGEQSRDFTFVSDVVAAFLAAAEKKRWGKIFNVGSGRPSKVNELVKLLGSPASVHIPKRPGEPDCTFADITAITRELGWASSVPFAEGVAIMMKNIEYWRDAPVWTPQTIETATVDWFKHLGKGA